jgi:hypothetical protein
LSSSRPRFEVADVVRAHLEQYRRVHGTSATEDKVLGHIADCRTAALGGHIDECENGDYSRHSYNSCQDRNCPKCQSLRQLDWIAKRAERLLPVDYFHVVFTIPHELNALTLRNKKLIYRLLFAAASKSLLEMARDRRHLGADIGITAVLHSWGQNLSLHPHLHCVVTAGGLAPEGDKWVEARRRTRGSGRFLLPVKPLASLFRGKLLAALQQAYDSAELKLAGTTAELADPLRWVAYKDRLYRKDWNVYAKAPFDGVEQVFRYLGRYTHRVAISNYRIVDISGGKVTFTVKDYADASKKKVLTLDALEFLRRFLMHIVPKAFHRIRHYGLFAGANVNTKLVVARHILHSSGTSEQTVPINRLYDPSLPWSVRFLALTGIDLMRCPRCAGRLRRRPLETTDAPSASITARGPPRAA